MGPLGLANALSSLNSLGIAVIYARVAGAQPFGVYQLAFAVTAVIGIVTLSGSATASTRAAAQGRVAAWPLFVTRLPYTVAGSGVLWVAGGVMAVAGNATLAAALVAAGLTVPLFYGADVYPAHLLGVRDYRAYLRYQAVVQTTTLGTLAAAVAIAPKHPWLAVLAVAGVTGTVQFGGLLSLRASSHAVDDDLTYARRITGVSMLSAIDARLDVILTGFLLGTREAGLLAVARAIPTQAKRLWEVLYQPFFARMASGSREQAAEIARRYRWPVVALFAGIGATIVIVAPWVIPGVFGRDFEEAVTVTRLLAVAGVVMVIGYLDEVLLKSQAEVRKLHIVYTVLPVTSLLALPPLVLLFGIEGVGIEAMLVAVIYVGLMARLRRSESNGDMRQNR